MTKRIPILTDTHAGSRAEHKAIMANQNQFYAETFWPAIDAEGGVTDIIHGGDLLDRRKYINFSALQNIKETFFDEAKKRNITIHWILGNHDLYYRESTKLNGFAAFREYDNVIAYGGPMVSQFDGRPILFVPWICDENRAETEQVLANFDGAALMGHLELAGFEMYRGVPNFHGVDTAPFDHIPLVMTGHYHHKSTKRNINYLGSPFEMSWADYGDKRGFHWWTPQTNTIELVENPFHLFYRYVYDDTDKPHTYIKEMLDRAKADVITQKIVKVIVKAKTQPVWFEMYMDAMLKLGPFDIQFVEDSSWSTEIDDDVTVSGEATMDSLTMIRWYVDNQPWPNDDIKDAVKTLMVELYHEAGDMAKQGIRT